jgi:hypothetical protein
VGSSKTKTAARYNIYRPRADVAGLVRFCRTCSQIISASKLEDSRYAVRCLSRKPNAADLQGLVIAKSPDRAWHANIERHFDKNLTPFTAEYRAFRISLEHTAPLGFVCELCGERRSGEELRVKVLHDDGETAIALACARARW